ncbi:MULTISPECIES: universal stress protein [unclassified Moritella]|uniref:universal stress protein n=1 Tax=unclassified Moritella TaxID=2637987 RepID=UPI001BAAC2C8|nr:MULTISPECIES: universal stress protein [unclassified Moritella]QUM83824.1 universal stress protein [Moritella sp. 28]QUM88113.1 universal stress protein [Moritella sp. 36]
MTINNILCPTDFSDIANKAISYAAEMALKYDATLHLVSVINEIHGFDSFQVLAITPNDIHEHMLKITQEKLDELTIDIKPSIPLHTAVLEGHPATEITQAAVDFDCDMIVIASHGRTGLEHILIGSVAESVTRHSHCPVLIVK